MIVHPNGSYEIADWFTADTYPDSYFIDESTEEGKALAEKVIQCGGYPYMELVVVDGRLVDVIPTERPPEPVPPPTEEEQIQLLDERTVGMQSIDDFTLQQQTTTNERTQGMQEIDDYTLQLVNDLQQQVTQLQADINILKGGA